MREGSRCPHGASTPSRQVMKVFAGSRVDCKFREAHDKPASLRGTGRGANLVGIGNRERGQPQQWPDAAVAGRLNTHRAIGKRDADIEAVSYTHLTLPTKA